MNKSGTVLFCLLICLFNSLYGQKILTESEATSFALKHSPNLAASELQIIQNRQLRGSAFNLQNPEILFESPTGEFYTPGIQQTFDFPAVYINRGKFYKQQMILSEKG